MYLISVEGNIIIRGGSQHAVSWVCGGAAPPCAQNDIVAIADTYKPEEYNRRTHTVKGNLVLTEKRHAVPYAVYVAKGDIVGDSQAVFFETWCDGEYLASFFYWEESAKSITFRNAYQDVPEIIQSSFYNGLYVECFSSMELLLCDLLLSYIYSSPARMKRAFEYFTSIDDKVGMIKDEKAIERYVHWKLSTIVYHRFDDVDELFFGIMSIHLPTTTRLKRLLHRRNNIVHRRSLSRLDRMTQTDATAKDVSELIACMEEFGRGLKTMVASAFEGKNNR